MSAGKTSQLQWQGKQFAYSANNVNERYLPFVEFAAAAESSTQHAFSRFKASLNFAEQTALTSSSTTLACSLSRLSHWLDRWVIEEENHVLFFSTLYSIMASKYEWIQDKNPKVFRVEQPIPVEQAWSTTLLFLLYSEIASMTWYQVWYQDASEKELRAALRRLHRDEVNHFRSFLAYCKEIAALQPGFEQDARRVLSFFAMTFRKIRQPKLSQVSFIGEQRFEINWWEHHIFQKVEGVGAVFGKIFALQKRSCEEIEFAAKRREI